MAKSYMKNYELWLKHALSNLEIARVGQFTENVLYSDLCFECQQAAEKSLKALLIFHDIDFPKTHSIQKLLDLLSNFYNIDLDLQRTILLSQHSANSRYPNEEIFEIDENDYKEALELAEFIFSWVNEKLRIT